MSDCMDRSESGPNFKPYFNLYENDLNSGTVIRVLKPDSSLGIESLSDICLKRLLNCQQLSFNIMLLGQTGIGKTTLIETLFKTRFNDESARSHSLTKVNIVSNYYDLVENQVKLRVGVIESKGFGDQINEDHCCQPIVEYIEQQFEAYLEEELKLKRTHQWPDNRVHVCLYLISPIGYGLRPIDFHTMKQLDTKVNLIPLIAKSDLITKQELKQLKLKIMSEIESNCINIYRFPTEDFNVSEINVENNSDLPFAVVASNQFVLIGDREVRARQYPWGSVEVENKSHCDLESVRQMILKTNLNDLIETTHYTHYETYRNRRQQFWKDKQWQHLNQMKARERQLIDNFTAKLRSKELELKRSEQELHQMFETMSKQRIEEKMKIDLYKQRLEDDIRSLDVRKLFLGQTLATDSKESSDDKQSTIKSKSKTK